MWQFEKDFARKGYRYIAGLDEAGRGPLAGPVVSAAVILGPDFHCPGINDSKKLSEKKRGSLFPVIQEQALAWAVGICDPREIDRINILQASLLSMKRAAKALALPPDLLLIDGRFILDADPDLKVDQMALVRGDSRSISIAAASILAKVTRDRIMEELDKTYPVYGFARHKGYPTRAHRCAILEHGPCPVHRRTFKGVS